MILATAWRFSEDICGFVMFLVAFRAGFIALVSFSFVRANTHLRIWIPWIRVEKKMEQTETADDHDGDFWIYSAQVALSLRTINTPYQNGYAWVVVIHHWCRVGFERKFGLEKN